MTHGKRLTASSLLKSTRNLKFFEKPDARREKQKQMAKICFATLGNPE